MKLFIRTVFFHILCITIFAFLYYIYSDHFDNGKDNENEETVIDFLLLSTTIQAGVGISDLTPKTFYSKIVMIIQQLIMISTHVFTLYVFNL